MRGLKVDLRRRDTPHPKNVTLKVERIVSGQVLPVSPTLAPSKIRILQNSIDSPTNPSTGFFRTHTYLLALGRTIEHAQGP